MILRRHPEIKDYVRRAYRRDRTLPPVMILISSPGTGKTFTMRAVHRWWRKVKPVKPVGYAFMGWVDMHSTRPDRRSLSDLFHASGSYDGSVAAREALGGLLRVNLLVVDDFGNEPRWCAPETVSAGLCDLIDGRVEKKRHTVITTNLSAPEILARYGARLHSRIVNGALRVVLPYDDRRKK